ncbi:hypothetical protein EGW08_007530, partial [Elysia chlorotica]
SPSKDYFQEFYEQTYTPPEEKAVSISATEVGQSKTQLKLSKSSASNPSVHAAAEEEKSEHALARLNEESMEEEEEEIPLEPMLEAHEPDDCDDFYYISKGWGLYLTVMRAFPLALLLDPNAMERVLIRCTTHFYHLSHTCEQHPTKDCLVQIPKTEEFVKVGTVLVFARKNVAIQNEAPDPDDSVQEHMISDDMKTTWNVNWHNQEKERWSLISGGIANKRSRVVFKTRLFTSFLVVQLNIGDERSEREEDDEASSSEEEEPTLASGEEEDGEKEEKEHTEDTVKDDRSESSKKPKRASRGKSFASSLYGMQDTVCLADEAESEEMPDESGEGEGEDLPEDKPEDSGATAEVVEPTEDTGEPGAPAPSPLVNKEDANKDDNASNVGRRWSSEEDRGGNNNSNNNAKRQDELASANKNNNQIRDNDESFDQSKLPPEERTIIVGLPPASSSFARPTVAPSVYGKWGSSSAEVEEAENNEAGEESTSENKSSSGEAATTHVSPMDDSSGARTTGSKVQMELDEEEESDEDLPVIPITRMSISVMKNGVKVLQGFKFGPDQSSLPLVGVDMDNLKSNIAMMWRYRNHRNTSVLVFSRPRGDNEFDMCVDVVQSVETYVRAEGHYSVGYKMVAESQPIPIKPGRFLSFTIEGNLIVERCEGGVPSTADNLRTRTMYFSHKDVNSLQYVVKRPQVEEVKGPSGKKGKKREEAKVDTEPDARLEVMGINASSSTNGVDLAALTIWLTGPDLWQERHVHLRESDNKLLSLLIDCLTKSKALARNWWRLIILLGYSEVDVEKEKGKTPPKQVVGMFLRRWFEDCLNHNDRGILHLIHSLHRLDLEIAIGNVVRILKIYKSHLLNEPVRPRYLKLLFHWVLQTKITRNNLLRCIDPVIMRPVSDVFLLHLSNFLPKQHLYKIGAA